MNTKQPNLICLATLLLILSQPLVSNGSGSYDLRNDPVRKYGGGPSLELYVSVGGNEKGRILYKGLGDVRLVSGKRVPVDHFSPITDPAIQARLPTWR